MSELKKLYHFLQQTKLQKSSQLYSLESSEQFANFCSVLKRCAFYGFRAQSKIDYYCEQLQICIDHESKIAKLTHYLIYKSIIYVFVFYIARVLIAGTTLLISKQDCCLVLMGCSMALLILQVFYRKLPHSWAVDSRTNSLAVEAFSYFESYLLSKVSNSSGAALDFQKRGLAWNDVALQGELKQKVIDQNLAYKKTEALLPVYELVLGTVFGSLMTFVPLANSLT